MGRSVIAHSLSYLAYGKGVTLDGSPARLALGAATKVNLPLNCFHNDSHFFNSPDIQRFSVEANPMQCPENLVLRQIKVCPRFCPYGVSLGSRWQHCTLI